VPLSRDTRPSAILDTNLLVLFLVGTADRSYISRHRRLRAYSEADFDLLLRLLESVRTIIVTPNILTEVSNLARQIDDPARTRIGAVFRTLLDAVDERHVPSRHAASHPEFLRLGLTDVAIMEEMANGHILLTADLDLYLAVSRRGHQAENFNHLRQL
jgi:hypothetical protein